MSRSLDLLWFLEQSTCSALLPTSATLVVVIEAFQSFLQQKNLIHMFDILPPFIIPSMGSLLLSSKDIRFAYVHLQEHRGRVLFTAFHYLYQKSFTINLLSQRIGQCVISCSTIIVCFIPLSAVRDRTRSCHSVQFLLAQCKFLVAFISQ